MSYKASENDILPNLFEGVYFVDKNREILTWNKGAEQITGFKADDVVSKRCYDNILNHVDENGVALCFSGCPLEATILDGTPREANVYLQHIDGYRVPVTVRTIPLFDEKREVTGAMEFFNETRSEKSLMNRIEQYRKESTEDPLTKLPNRRYIEAILESKIREFKTINASFGVAFLDIDDFKKVNDKYGHDVGDQVLILVSKTVRANLRSNDYIARWGGEEFVILFSNVDLQGMGIASEKIRHLIETSEIRSMETKVQVTVSIGASISTDADTVERLVKRTDELMYASKKSGKNRVTIG